MYTSRKSYNPPYTQLLVVLIQFIWAKEKPRSSSFWPRFQLLWENENLSAGHLRDVIPPACLALGILSAGHALTPSTESCPKLSHLMHEIPHLASFDVEEK